MEPKILLIGRNISTLKILQDELEKFDRIIAIANSEELIEANLKDREVDLIIVGAGLPDETKELMVEYIKKIAPETELHIMEKTPEMTPVSMISYTNDKAVMWKMMAARK